MTNPRQEETRESVFDSLPDMVLVVGPDLTIVRANAAARNRWGDRLEGRSYLELYAKAFPPDKNTVRDTFETGEPQSMELHTGDPRAGECLAIDSCAVLDDRGNVEFVVESVKVVSGRRHVYTVCPKSCSRMNEHRERLASLGQLAAGVAHEIGNPLASMSSLVQNLMAEAELESQQSLQQLWAQIGRMQRRLDRIRQLSRRPRKDKAVCNLGGVVEQSLELVQFDPRWDTVSLIEEIDMHLAPVVLSEDAIFQVVHNLVFNALEALTGQTNATLWLTVSALDARTLMLEVGDNGAGIPRENHSVIFEPFFTTNSHGTGLGLAISRELIEALGGELTFESTVGKGTCFRATIPVADQQSQELCEP